MLAVVVFVHGNVSVTVSEGVMGRPVLGRGDLASWQFESLEFRFALFVQFFSSWAVVVAALAVARVLALGGRPIGPATVVRDDGECETAEA